MTARAFSYAACVAALFSVTAIAHAQPVAPAADAELPPGHPPVGQQLPPGHPAVAEGATADGAQAGAAAAPKPVAIAQPAADVPPGSIRVHVLDAADQPVANADVQIGTMSQESGRTTIAGKTDATGTARFDKLATGDKLAYRVNVLHEGAKFSSTPFRLPPEQGYDAVIRRLDTTRDDREIVLYVGATSIELKDERLKIVQQARLLNVGRKAYVFPDKGLLIGLPPGVMAFQVDEVMTDQHLTEDAGHGLRLQGSLLPGEVTLTWGFDLPREGTTADLSFDIPWPTFAYRVLADAADGLSLEVDELPKAELHADEGRRYLVTELMRSPGEPPLRKVGIHLRGIPGPGPMRYIASALALLLLAAGVVLAKKTSAPLRVLPLQAIADRKATVLGRVRALDEEHRRGDIGPEFHAQGIAALEEELAALLYEEARAKQAS